MLRGAKVTLDPTGSYKQETITVLATDYEKYVHGSMERTILTPPDPSLSSVRAHDDLCRVFPVPIVRHMMTLGQ